MEFFRFFFFFHFGFLILVIHFFPQIWEVFSYLIFMHLSLLILRFPSYGDWFILWCPLGLFGLLTLFHSFSFFLLFWLDNFTWPLFKLAVSLFSLIESAIEPSYWTFQFRFLYYLAPKCVSFYLFFISLLILSFQLCTIFPSSLSYSMTGDVKFCQVIFIYLHFFSISFCNFILSLFSWTF